MLVSPSRERDRLRRAREAIAALGIETHRPGEAIGVDAARLTSAHPISLPDAYCLSTARHVGASLAAFDEKVVRAGKVEGISLAS